MHIAISICTWRIWHRLFQLLRLERTQRSIKRGCAPSGIVTASPDPPPPHPGFGVRSGANGWRIAHTTPTLALIPIKNACRWKNQQRRASHSTLAAHIHGKLQYLRAICGCADMTVLLVRKHIIKAAAWGNTAWRVPYGADVFVGLAANTHAPAASRTFEPVRRAFWIRSSSRKKAVSPILHRSLSLYTPVERSLNCTGQLAFGPKRKGGIPFSSANSRWYLG